MYERLYRHDISDGVDLAAHATSFRIIYNSIRPHESIGMARPLERYRKPPNHQHSRPRICLKFLTRDRFRSRRFTCCSPTTIRYSASSGRC